MKWFWYSLIVFCLLMCSCKTKKLDSHVKVKSEVRSDLAILNESVKISTKNHAYFAKEVQSVVIEEDITVTEYDKDGKKTKETNAKRKVIQDSDKISTEEEIKGIAEVVNDSTHHVADASTMIDESVKEESEGGQKSFGKWLGIVIGLGILLGAVVLILYLRKKSKRVSKLFDVED